MKNEKLIIISPGWGNSTFNLKLIENRFRNEGFDVIIVLNDPEGIHPSAMRLAGALQRAHEEYEHISFIGYSMGGLVGRYLIHKFPQYNYIDSYTSIGTPHDGTLTAQIAYWSNTAHEMKIDSELIRDLNKFEWPPQIPALAIQADRDLLVIPGENSKFSFAENIMIPHSTHLTVIMSKRTFHEINSWISSIFFPNSFFTRPQKKGTSSHLRQLL